MKTIEQASYEFAKKTGGDNFTRVQLELAFEAGVEFANRWIPIEEELPDMYQLVIVRKSGKYRLASLQSGDVFVEYNSDTNTTILLNVDEWRLFL